MFLKPPYANVTVKCVGNAPHIPNPGTPSGRKNSRHISRTGDRLEIAPGGEDPYAESKPVKILLQNWTGISSCHLPELAMHVSTVDEMLTFHKYQLQNTDKYIQLHIQHE
jgi:hypothetical protein